MKMFAWLREQNYLLFEVFIVLRIVALLVPALAAGILIQDKICYVTHRQSVSFCQNIQKEASSAEQQHLKDQILADSAQFGNYKHLVSTIPLVLWCLFLGPFLDNYESATYIMFLMNLIGDIASAVMNLVLIYFFDTSPYYLLLPTLTIWFTGGLNSFSTTAGLYITLTTKEESRSVKFAFLEIVGFSSLAIATFLGGQLLRTRDSESPPLRTYHYNYLFVILLNSICLVVLFFLFIVDRSNLKKQVKEKEHHQLEDVNNNTEDAKTKTLDLNSKSESPEVKLTLLTTLFNLDNVRQTVKCFFKRRPKNVRMQIFLLCFIQYSQLIITTGLDGLMVQFAQKLYHWSPSSYSTFQVVKQIADVVTLSIFSAILVVKFKLQDSTLICLAQISNFCADLVRGTFLSPLAFFVSIPFGGLSWFGIISAKNKFSRIIPKEEVGKIFSLNAVVESVVPLASSFIYSNIFSLSVSAYPGMIYHFSCLLMILTVGILTVEHAYCPVKSFEDYQQEEPEEPKKETDPEMTVI